MQLLESNAARIHSLMLQQLERSSLSATAAVRLSLQRDAYNAEVQQLKMQQL